MRSAAFGFIALILLIASGWSWFAGPCEVYTFSPASKTPARCLMNK
jgi:hypothetical protein